MSSATFYSTTNDDNGYWNTSGSLISGPADPAFGDVAGVGQHSWILIRTVNIPQEATIESAKITIKAYDNRALTTCNANIFVVIDEDRGLPSSYEDVEGRAVSSPVSWSNIGSFTSGSFYDTIDITSALQELVNLSSWSYGGNALFFIKNNGSSTNAVRYFSSFYTPSNTDNPRLYAEWTPREGYCDIPKLTAYGSASSNSAYGTMSLRINNDGLGGISCFASSGSVGSMSVPSSTMSATAKPGNDGVMTFPVATLTGLVGARGDVSLPVATMGSWTINSSDGSISIVPPVVLASGKNGIVGSVAATIPVLGVSGTALVGMVASGFVQLRLVADGRGTNGQITFGRISMRIRPMTATGVARVVSKGVGVINILPAECSANAVYDSSEFSSPVVYDQEVIR